MYPENGFCFVKKHFESINVLSPHWKKFLKYRSGNNFLSFKNFSLAACFYKNLSSLLLL